MQSATPNDIHRVYMIWPLNRETHVTETWSLPLATDAFAQLTRMRLQSEYAIGAGWDVNGIRKQHFDFGSGLLCDD